jgi:hypothetical protein
MNNATLIDDVDLYRCLVLIENENSQSIALNICSSVFEYLNVKDEILIIDPYSLELDWGSYQSLKLPPVYLDINLVPYYWIKRFTPTVNLAIAIGQFKLSLDKTTPLSLLDQLCRSNNIPLFITKLK